MFIPSRSVSIAGEAERKMVREIVRRARDPVKSRVVPTEIVDKYRKKLALLEADVKAVLEEEVADREIAKLENRANRLQNKIAEKPEDPNRVWFQTKKERQEEKAKLKGEPGSALKDSKRMKKKPRKAEDPEDAKERRRMEAESSYIVRQVKKSRKPKKLSSFSEKAKQQKGGKGTKKSQSSFDMNFKKKGGGGIKKKAFKKKV